MISSNSAKILQKLDQHILFIKTEFPYYKMYKVDTGVTGINLINATCNVNFIVTSYLKNAPSAIESITCSKCPISIIY